MDSPIWNPHAWGLRLYISQQWRRQRLILSILAGLGSWWLTVSAPVVAADAADADFQSRWRTYDQNSTDRLEHSVWERFLEAYVTTDQAGATRVDYNHVRPTDKVMLDAYIAYLERVRIGTYNRQEQMAFWINLYNALTIRLVLRHYPLQSIRDIDISPGWFAVGPWGAPLTKIEGQILSLDDIEHSILRPIWQDPRLHYALNCAAVGCPNLMPRAFTSAGLGAQLDAAARAFVNHPRAVSIESNGVRVSRLYKWYREDFGETDANVLDHLRKFAAVPLSRVLNGVSSFEFSDYDWSLNDHRDKFRQAN
ncbi:MAG TPA: DUF547 domain-containing protein [Sneathiellales bacterium]|jgi:hypothetical protein|nr:DUF547 domain-containing protein [Sneathiellales bacterium]